MHQVRPKEAVDGVEQTGEGHVPDEAYLKACEEATVAFNLLDLAGSVEHASVLVEADHFEARLDNRDRVRHHCHDGLR